MKKENNKKKVDQIYQKEKMKRELNEIMNKKIANLLSSKEISAFFQKYKNQITFIFDFLSFFLNCAYLCIILIYNFFLRFYQIYYRILLK